MTVHIAAEPETVFPYFVDPDRYVQWMGGNASIEPMPGGKYRVRMRGGVEATGVFLEIDPPKRVVLRHHDLPDDEQRHHHGKGWRMYLDRLAIRAIGGDPGPDPNA